MSLFSRFWDRIFGGAKQPAKVGSYRYNISYSSNPITIYQSELVKDALSAKANERAKCFFRAIRKKTSSDSNVSDSIEVQSSSLERLFEGRPNPILTWHDLLYCTSWRLDTCFNAYWLPIFKDSVDPLTAKVTRDIQAIYLIDTISEYMSQDANGDLWITFNLRNGGVQTVPYDSIIHLRDRYSSKRDYFLGNEDREELLTTIRAESDLIPLIPTAIKSSLKVGGVIAVQGLVSEDEKKSIKSKFDEVAASGESDFAVTDSAHSFTPVSANPQKIDSATMSYLDNRICASFGVPMSIILRTAGDQDWQSFYDGEVQPFVEELEQCLNSSLLTDSEKNFGNMIRVYDKKIEHLSFKQKLDFATQFATMGYISRDEARGLFGYDPDGGPSQVSLNYVQALKQNQYQIGSGDDKINDDGGSSK